MSWSQLTFALIPSKVTLPPSHINYLFSICTILFPDSYNLLLHNFSTFHTSFCHVCMCVLLKRRRRSEWQKFALMWMTEMSKCYPILLCSSFVLKWSKYYPYVLLKIWYLDRIRLMSQPYRWNSYLAISHCHVSCQLPYPQFWPFPLSPVNSKLFYVLSLSLFKMYFSKVWCPVFCPVFSLVHVQICPVCIPVWSCIYCQTNFH